MRWRRGRTIAGWLALAAVLAACRHPLASPYPVPADPFDLGALLAGAGGPDQTAIHPASAGPDHPLQTVLAYLGLLVAAGAAFGALARKPSALVPEASPHLAGPADIARQLNHDVKNGLVPVRNVFRHLAQVARHEPERLPAVLLERQATVEAGIAYLETLARNYASRSPGFDRRPCDLNAIVSDVALGLVDAPVVLHVDLHQPLPPV